MKKRPPGLASPGSGDDLERFTKEHRRPEEDTRHTRGDGRRSGLLILGITLMVIGGLLFVLGFVAGWCLQGEPCGPAPAEAQFLLWGGGALCVVGVLAFAGGIFYRVPGEHRVLAGATHTIHGSPVTLVELRSDGSFMIRIGEHCDHYAHGAVLVIGGRSYETRSDFVVGGIELTCIDG